MVPHHGDWGEVVSLVRYTKITLDEVLCFLTGRTHAASTMGAQLDQARALYHGGQPHGQFSTANEMHVKAPIQDVFAAQERAESQILENISVAKCLDALAQVQQAHILKDRPALAKLHKLVPERTQGELVVQCLRAYEEWRLKSEERALAAVYAWAGTHAPLAFPPVSHEEDTLTQAFRVGAAKRARQKASELYADCYLVIAEWVVQWNMRRMAPALKAAGRKVAE